MAPNNKVVQAASLPPTVVQAASLHASRVAHPHRMKPFFAQASSLGYRLGYRLAVFCGATLLLSTLVLACNIPVFRYALERWKPDACEVFVFCDASFDAKQHGQLSQLMTQSQERRSNLSVTLSQVGIDNQPQHVELWETIRKLPGVKLPYVVVRTSVNDKQSVNSWHGELANFKAEQLLDSPARRELSKRLLKGDAVVWVLLKSSKQERNEQVTKLLTTELKKLAKDTPFPKVWGCQARSCMQSYRC